MKHFQPGCPHYWLIEIFGSPDVQYCEQLLCSHITAPALAYSNFLYILLGMLALKRSRNSAGKTFSALLITIGIVSFTYHATNNALSQFFDLFGIFLFLSFMQYVIAKRFNYAHLKFFFIPLLSLSILFFLFKYFGIKTQVVIMLYTPILVIQDLLLINRNNRATLFYFLSIGLIFLGNIANLIDVNNLLCNPNNHFFQFHALWHILSALGIYYYFSYLKRISVFK